MPTRAFANVTFNLEIQSRARDFQSEGLARIKETGATSLVSKELVGIEATVSPRHTCNNKPIEPSGLPHDLDLDRWSVPVRRRMRSAPYDQVKLYRESLPLALNASWPPGSSSIATIHY